MLYFDTSFLAPLVVLEEASVRVTEFMGRLPAEPLTVSQWTRVELSSVLGLRVRMGRLKPKEAIDADAQFEATIERSFTTLLPTADDFRRAREFLQKHKLGLRAGDALHLAIASNHRAETIYSLDKTMLKAGRSLGLPLSSGIRLAGYSH
jgi:predicted nucleic acid-binding protein